jgi:hypothetical protein
VTGRTCGRRIRKEDPGFRNAVSETGRGCRGHLVLEITYIRFQPNWKYLVVNFFFKKQTYLNRAAVTPENYYVAT